MLGVVYKGVAFPLLFTMLDKRGNSNSQERIDLVDRFIELFGKDLIKSIVADREFVGDHWLDFLNRNGIDHIPLAGARLYRTFSQLALVCNECC